MTQFSCLVATLFAYGQTASGKTHTIMGANDEPGMIPLALSDIFLYMETQVWHQLWCYEVYSNDLYFQLWFFL